MEVIKSCSTLNGGCMQVCTKRLGNIQCSCNAGYQLEADERSCTGKVEFFMPWLQEFKDFFKQKE